MKAAKFTGGRGRDVKLGKGRNEGVKATDSGLGEPAREENDSWVTPDSWFCRGWSCCICTVRLCAVRSLGGGVHARLPVKPLQVLETGRVSLRRHRRPLVNHDTKCPKAKGVTAVRLPWPSARRRWPPRRAAETPPPPLCSCPWWCRCSWFWSSRKPRTASSGASWGWVWAEAATHEHRRERRTSKSRRWPADKSDAVREETLTLTLTLSRLLN